MRKLVCTVGTRNYNETNYYFGERQSRTNLAPVAIGRCVIETEDGLELVALLTDDSGRMHGEQLKREAEGEGWVYKPVTIPSGESEAELWEIFDAFGSQLVEKDEIVLDFTHGFRHIPALLLSATQYYVIRKDLTLQGIYYGAWEARDTENNSPILDLTPLYDLSEWTYGIRLLRDYRLSMPLGKMLDRVQRRSHTDPASKQRYTRLQKIGRSLEKLEGPLVSGLPLEAGFAANEALKNVQADEKEIARIPPMKEPWRELKEQLQEFRLKDPGGKGNVLLTLDELHRQSTLVEGYLKVDNLWAAANLLREWIISTVIFHSGDTDNWLDYGERRKPVESKLGALSEWSKHASLKEALTKEQNRLLACWNRVSNSRNALAHAGMRKENTNLQPDTFRQAFDELRAKLEDEAFWSIETADKTEEVWLISPLGTTPGALFTAIKKAEPDRLLVFTSEQGKGLVPEVLRAAGREDLNPCFAVLDDPFNDFEEARELVGSLRREHGLDWIRAKSIIVNLTGGTTCLGWTVGRLENGLKRISLNPRTVACIDRRSPEEQRGDPYREGEMQDIEPDEKRQ